MITENFVSFETGKLLEEKGFPINEFHKGEIGVFKGIAVSKITKEIVEKEMLSCIPQSAVMKWLREVHHYYIQVMLDSWACDGHSGYYVILQRTDNDFEMMLQDAVEEVFYQTYEDACETAIKYCLTNLI